MSTKRKTVQKFAFQPQALNVYKQLQSPISKTLQGYLKDPRKSGFFNLRLKESLANAQQLTQRMFGNVGARAQAGGFAGSNLPAFMQSEQARVGRAGSKLESQAFIQNILAQEQFRQNALNQAMSMRPLQTGGTTTQKTSGLGTWLPQVVSAGLGAAATAATGGAAAPAMAGARSGVSAVPFAQGPNFLNIPQPNYR